VTRLLRALGRLLDWMIASNCTLCGAPIRGALCDRCTGIVERSAVRGGNPWRDLAGGHERDER